MTKLQTTAERRELERPNFEGKRGWPSVPQTPAAETSARGRRHALLQHDSDRSSVSPLVALGGELQHLRAPSTGDGQTSFLAATPGSASHFGQNCGFSGRQGLVDADGAGVRISPLVPHPGCSPFPQQADK